MHRLTASVAYVTTLTYASTNDQWARPAFPLANQSIWNQSICHFQSGLYVM